MPNLIQAYMEGFLRNYPHHDVKVRPMRGRKHGDEPRYSVIINGDRGDISLSEDDLRSATRAFNRGK